MRDEFTPVRWGVLGAGWLVNTATASAIHNASGAVLEATAARDIDRARATEPRRAFNDYQALIDDPDIDAVYICLANDAHLPWITAAARAGKHVLCEKPLTLSEEQAGEAFAAAAANGVILSEATWTRWHPRMRRIVELATSGALGAIDDYFGSFTFSGVAKDNYRLRAVHGGGALYDVGIYPLHALIACLPDNTHITPQAIERVMGDEVDLTTDATLQWETDGAARILSSFVSEPQQELRLTGSEMSLHTLGNNAFASWREPTQLQVGDHVETFEAVDAYQLMFEGFSAAVRGEGGWVLPAQDSLRVAAIVDSLLW